MAGSVFMTDSASEGAAMIGQGVRETKWFWAGAVIAVAGLFLSACTTVARTAASAESERAEVSLTDFKVAVSGAVSARTPFRIAVRNDGKAVHTLAIEAAGKTISTRVLNADETATLSVPALEAGAYKLWCTVGGHREAGMQTTFAVGSGSGNAGLSSEEMDRAHEAGIKAFPAKTQGTPGSVLAHRVAGGVKVFEVTAKSVRWEVSPGEFIDAYAFNGQIPGPQIRVRQGDKVKIVVRNELLESTTVHFHGLTVPNAMDGVPFITQPPIKRGATFAYEFTVTDGPGTYMYHSHHNALAQVGKGLFGSFVIEDPKPAWNQEATVMLGDGELGYTLNGKGFPATAPIVANRGSKVLLRFLNAGQMLHPMHLHGFHFTVIARDGRPTTPYVLDTLTVAPGERYDAVFTANLPGTWAFHCHVLSHVESEHGMHGMVTAVIVR